MHVDGVTLPNRLGMRRPWTVAAWAGAVAVLCLLRPEPTTPPSEQGTLAATTTGIPEGTVLTASGSLTIGTPGAVVSGLDVRGTVTITASNVTFRNSRVRATGWNVVKVADGARGVVIENVELDGSGTSGASNSMGVYGPATVRRANIHGVENGVTPFSGSVVEANWIHHLAAPGSPHYDGVQIDGGASNITVRGNLIDLREHGQTAAVMVDNHFGGLDNISITGNRLLGAGYTVYCDGRFNSSPLTRIAFTNNRIGHGHWGPALIASCSPTWSGNVDDTTGQTIIP